MALKSRGLVRLREKFKMLYLHYHNAYEHQIWQGGDLPWGAPTYKVIWPFDHMVLQDYVTCWNHYIPTITVSMVTKLDRIVTYIEPFSTIKLLEPLVTWSYKITWQAKIIIFATTVPMAYIFGRLVTFFEGLLWI